MPEGKRQSLLSVGALCSASALTHRLNSSHLTRYCASDPLLIANKALISLHLTASRLSLDLMACNVVDQRGQLLVCR